jgi:hypothetical protein
MEIEEVFSGLNLEGIYKLNVILGNANQSVPAGAKLVSLGIVENETEGGTNRQE